jgi:pyruvate kinase
MRKTKIICTLGPALDDPAVLKQLFESGVNAVRLNFAHGNSEEHLRRLRMVKQLSSELNIPVASILDTKGPEIRIRAFATDRVTLTAGSPFTITTENIIGDEHRVSTTYARLHEALKPGDRILLDDGLIELRVTGIQGPDIACTVVNGGVLSGNKSMNIPDVSLRLESPTAADVRNIRFAVDNGADFVAASFIRNRRDVLAVRSLLDEMGGNAIRIISKIENREGVDNLEEIVEVSDAVMVARGDLGVEINAWEVPIIQKRMIAACAARGKPVIVATQMLDSMIRNPRPTRAEVSDVATAVFDGADCVMLSGETAAGNYPVESVVTMSKILTAAEESVDYWKRFRALSFEKKAETVSDAISHACCATAMDLSAGAVITVTTSGYTARMISRFRPNCPIVALTSDETVRRQLSISWGVIPEAGKMLNSTDELFEEGIAAALRTGVVAAGSTVVLTAGVPIGISGTTNLIKVQQIA